MVKTRLQRDIAVVQTVRIQLHLRSTGWSAEEVDDPAFSHYIDRPLPRCRASHSLNDNVSTSSVRCQGASRSYHVLRCSYVHDTTGSKQFRRANLVLPLH